MRCLEQRSPEVPRSRACHALGLSRTGTYPRNRRVSPPSPNKGVQPNALSEAEKQAIRDQLHSPDYEDLGPRVVHAKELNAGRLLASLSTYYRVLRAAGETAERRNQRPPQRHAVPRLVAERPLAVATWDITKLPTTQPRRYLNLYLVIDLFSRFPLGWLISRKENAAVARHLFHGVLQRYGIEPGQLIVHQDRGAPMIAHSYREFLDAFGVQRSYSRPRVSNDNAFSEAINKTLKYSPGYPGRFADIGHARQWTGAFMQEYQHRPHEGLAGFTPYDVFHGHVESTASRRQAALDAHYAAHPNRYPNGPPTAKRPQSVVTINADAHQTTAEELLNGPDEQLTTQPPTVEVPSAGLP